MAKSIALKPKVGGRASDFEAQDQHGQPVSPAVPRRNRNRADGRKA